MSDPKDPWVNAGLAAGSLAVAALCAELILGLAGIPTLASCVSGVLPGNFARISTSPCSADTVEAFMERVVRRPNAYGGWFWDKELGLLPKMNLHGFNDPKDFYADYGDRKKVLVLGDSFTFGLSAAPGHGWVDLLNAHDPDLDPLFFNTGISGFGQMDQYAVLKKYHAVVRPDAVLLLFCSDNDFSDNMKTWDRSRIPLSAQLSAEYEKQMLAELKKNIQCPDKEDPVLYRKAWIQAHLREVFWKSRTGTVLWAAGRWIKNLFRPARSEEAGFWRPEPENPVYARTKARLMRIQRYLADRGTPFYAAAVPDIMDSKWTLVRSHNYEMVLRIFEELGIPYVDLFPEFDMRDYKTRWPLILDAHWNDRGHRKMAEIVRGRIVRGEWIGEALRPGERKADS